MAELSQPADELASAGSQAAVRSRAQIDRLAALCDKLRRRGRSHDFVRLLLPLLRSLSRYARRELRTRLAAGDLPGGHTTVGELLDEVTVAAWDGFARRPQNQPLDLWLLQLIDQALQRACEPIAQQSLDERQAILDSEARDAFRSEWVEMPSEMESIELSSLIPAHSSVGAWDELDIETKQANLDEIFAQLPRLQRQSLMLHVVEGYDRAEIADFQSRPREEVDSDLASAERTVRRIFQEQGWLQLEEDLENETFARTRRTHRS